MGPPLTSAIQSSHNYLPLLCQKKNREKLHSFHYNIDEPEVPEFGSIVDGITHSRCGRPRKMASTLHSCVGIQSPPCFLILWKLLGNGGLTYSLWARLHSQSESNNLGQSAARFRFRSDWSHEKQAGRLVIRIRIGALRQSSWVKFRSATVVKDTEGGTCVISYRLFQFVLRGRVGGGTHHC